MIISIFVAGVGIILLFFAAPDQSASQFVLRGTVVAKHGNVVTVSTNVTLSARNLTKGEYIEAEVFWYENRFVATH